MQDIQTRLSDAFRNKRVLVTGHTGFKGSWLSAWLHLLGAEVTGLALAPQGREDHFVQLQLTTRLDHVEGDVRDFQRVQGIMRDARPEFVFHLAAQALVRRSHEDPKLTFDTNVGGSVNVLEAVRRSDSVRALIYVTSDKCYRNQEWTWGYRENDQLGGSCPYSASKACAELVLSAYQASFFSRSPSLRAASVRAGNIIGGGDWAQDRIVPDCIRALRCNRKITVRNPAAIRPWQHVLEPLAGYLLLAARLHEDKDGESVGAWNFGPDKMAGPCGPENSLTVERLVKAVVEAWGSGQYVLADRSKAGGPAETGCLRLNCDKAYHQLGWRPLWDFDRTIQHTVAWYKNWLAGHDAWDLTTGQIAEYMAAWSDRGEFSRDRRSYHYAA